MNMKHRISKNKTSDEAEVWFKKLHAGPVTPETQASFDAWLAKSPAHQAEFELFGAIWEGFDKLKENPNALMLINTSLAKKPTFAKRKWFHKFKLALPVYRSLAAATAAVLIVAGIWWTQRDITTKKTYQTITGMQKIAYLPDGSKIQLDTKTVLTAAFSEQVRQIELIEGRATFSVVRDAKRPFIVHAGHVSARALGTVFNVYRKETGQVSVAVTEGSVQVIKKKMPATAGSDQKLATMEQENMLAVNNSNIQSEPRYEVQIQEVLVSGQAVTIDEDTPDYKITSVDIKQIGSWGDGKLYFRNKPLEEIIVEINRYLDHKIIIDDEQLKDHQLNLNFFVRHRKEFLETLKLTLPITSRTTSEGDVIISRKS